jgi:hypothetical protein
MHSSNVKIKRTRPMPCRCIVTDDDGMTQLFRPFRESISRVATTSGPALLPLDAKPQPDLIEPAAGFAAKKAAQECATRRCAARGRASSERLQAGGARSGVSRRGPNPCLRPSWSPRRLAATRRPVNLPRTPGGSFSNCPNRVPNLPPPRHHYRAGQPGRGRAGAQQAR